MDNKITFPNKSSILYNSNSESFVGMEEDFDLDFELEEALARLEHLSKMEYKELLIKSGRKEEDYE